MKKTQNKKITALLTALGIFLIASSVIAMAVSKVMEQKMADNAQSIVSDIGFLIPQAQDGIPDDRFDTMMPVLQVDSMDFVAMIEIPSFDKTLPVYGTWDTKKVSDFPCRYTGSMYDGSLIIGGSDNKGQLDFMKMISNGDTVSVTDMTGLRFNYIVTDIRRTKDVSTDNLTDSNNDLVLFARNTYSLDYTVVRCKLRNNF